MPIIASNDGGVHEFIQDKKTGILINNPNDVKSYINELRKIQKDKTILSTYINNAQKLLKNRHSFNYFIKEIEEDF